MAVAAPRQQALLCDTGAAHIGIIEIERILEQLGEICFRLLIIRLVRKRGRIGGNLHGTEDCRSRKKHGGKAFSFHEIILSVSDRNPAEYQFYCT